MPSLVPSQFLLCSNLVCKYPKYLSTDLVLRDEAQVLNGKVHGSVRVIFVGFQQQELPCVAYPVEYSLLIVLHQRFTC